MSGIPAQTPCDTGADAERARRVREMFSRIAPGYDRLNHLLSFSIDRGWRRAAVRAALEERAALTPPRVLDLCCGTGDLSLAFADSGGHVVGADFAGPMLSPAREKCPDCRFAQADALRLPFVDGSFDVVSIAFGLRNLVDPRAGLAEMRRVLAPGGVLVILEFSLPEKRWLRPPYRFYLGRVLPALGNLLSRSTAYRYLADTVEDFAAPATVRGWMEAAGFDDTRVRPLTGGIAWLYRGRAR